MGERTPNLFLVGAMRSGTTALHEVLRSHPDIFMSPVKEPAFFADPAELALDSRVASAAGYAGNSKAYLSLFGGAGDVRYAGESSTHYTKLPRITGVAKRIAAMSPDARIVYLVRDPVERTLSHYKYAAWSKTERRELLDALRAEPFYVEVSNYEAQIRPYVDVFGMDRIWIGTLETLARDPEVQLGRLWGWLGLAPLPHDAAQLPHRNSFAKPVALARGPDALHRLGRSETYRRVARTVGAGRVRALIRRIALKPLSEKELTDPAAIEYLREVHAPHVAALVELTGMGFPEWVWATPR